MVQRHSRNIPCLQSPPRNIRALYFAATIKRPVYVKVATTMPEVESPGVKRFPSFESIMGTRAPIHECLVTTHDARGKAHEFLIAYQERPELPPNEALNEILPDISFRGELVVMQSGKRVFVVDLAGGRMATLAKEAVRR
ncbi:hypothetical protein PYCCODRAFT_1378947 [Trametes coccinea BRFM310]|uniref:Uncharacterized protein n=1 Tax=Trametes coccinea (strain BRFM310) TaxID=1353009 RepID=A0A1Y2I5X5_TRAC3|nr:hypothetical protein PYCCODRAFT_1378947 [Trametes coccinea BRFM310]